MFSLQPTITSIIRQQLNGRSHEHFSSRIQMHSYCPRLNLQWKCRDVMRWRTERVEFCCSAAACNFYRNPFFDHIRVREGGFGKCSLLKSSLKNTNIFENSQILLKTLLLTVALLINRHHAFFILHSERKV
jgi:hypothetical protein